MFTSVHLLFIFRYNHKFILIYSKSLIYNLIIKSMSSIDFQTIESYLLSDNKTEFLQKLVPGSEPYLYLTLLHSLNTSDEISSELESKIKEYRRCFNNDSSKQLHLQSLLMRYDTSTADKQAGNRQ